MPEPVIFNTLTDEQIAAIKGAKGSTSNKVKWWVIGVLGFILICAVAILIVIVTRKSPVPTINKIIDKSKREIDKADVEAKVEAAKSAGVEEAKVAEIQRIGEIKDVNERRKRLAELL